MADTDRNRLRRWAARPLPPIGVVLLFVVSYVPLLLTRPGMVGADTKTYLYLDPGRLLSRAPWMWDPNVGLGTVTHQNIGYLWPMGPYYWVMDAVGFPDWVAQRLWLGSIILAAGLGVRFMLRELRWVGPGLTVASFAYALSPYLLDYAARISVILLPFAGLPWLVGLASRSLRRNDWRSPAAFALVTLTVGGVNATSLLLVMVGPLLWFVHAVFVAREVDLRRALRVGLRITVLTLATSLWWMAGLALQGTFGIPILRYTETYETVAAAALSTEVLRGLGYWFFYGRDGLGAWTASTVTLIESLPALALSYALPVAGVTSGVLTRWRHRVYFATIVVTGMVISVGSHPWDSPSPYGAMFRAWSRSDLGLSFRSTPRAAPLVVLGIAVFLAAGVAALAERRPRWHVPVAGVLVVLICLNCVALFRGQMVDRNLMRDQELPEYWHEAAAHLDAGDAGTRVLEVPGIDFGAYRWGNTVDPVTPGLIDREFAARELIPYGSPPSANLLNDVDLPLQDGRVDPAAIGPLARILGVGDVVHRADLQFERFRTPRPRQLAERLDRAAGLGSARTFGEAGPNRPSPDQPLNDEPTLAATAPHPAPVTVYPVRNARPILRTVAASAPTVLAGNGAGLVTLASLGRLPADRPLLYSAWFADDEESLTAIIDEPSAELVVSDTNRRQARRWGSVRENDGYTERAGEEPVERDASDNRLVVFPAAGDDARTVTEVDGPVTASATAYGNGITYTAGDRPMNALDGDPTTAWRVGAFDEVIGEYLRVESEESVTADRLELLLTQEDKSRWITRISLVFDGDATMEVQLDERSLVPPGQTIAFPRRSFRTLDLVIEETNLGRRPTYRGVSDVGIAELRIPGVAPVQETIRPPVDLLRLAGPDSLARALTYAFARRASTIDEALGKPEEIQLRRWVEGPVARRFTVYGKGRVSENLSDLDLDRILLLAPAADGGVDASSSGRMPRDYRSRASAAVDGDPSTAFRSPFNGAAGSWIEFTYPSAVSRDGLDLSVVNDGNHSVPRRITVTVDGTEHGSYDVGPLADGAGRRERATTPIRLDTGPLRGSTFRLTVDEVAEVTTPDWFGGGPVIMPVGIAEVDLPTVRPPAADTPVDDRCREDLLRVGERVVPLRARGTVGDAAAGRYLNLEQCGPPTSIAAGRTLLESAPGALAGLEVDILGLSSAPGGGPGLDTVAQEQVAPAPASDAPETVTERTGRNRHRVVVSAADAPYWVVLGQSHNAGWRATTSTGVDLGEPTLVNGYANGWLVDPSVVGADVVVELDWAPQRWVWLGLALSAFGVLVCLALCLRPGRRTGVEPGRMVPRWIDPRSCDGPPRTDTRAAITALAVTGAAVLFGGPWVGLAVGAVTAVALLVAGGQVVLRLLVVGPLALSALFVVAKQFRNQYQTDFNWPGWFETTHAWTLAGVMLLGVDALVERMRTDPAGGAEEPPSAPGLLGDREQDQGGVVDVLGDEELGVGDA
jgi:arabinofuranan 3-O-arabinosyltransferase